MNRLAFESNYRDRSVKFGELVKGNGGGVSSLVAAGMIETYKDWMIYAPRSLSRNYGL